jgi:hypothetical protein
MVELLGPHRAILRSCVNEGATIRLVVAGEIYMDVVANLEEADSRGFGFELGEFAPFLDGDRVGLYFDSEALQFLADVRATLDTHIDIDLDDGKEGCS